MFLILNIKLILLSRDRQIVLTEFQKIIIKMYSKHKRVTFCIFSIMFVLTITIDYYKYWYL